jgi:hypothetical protein
MANASAAHHVSPVPGASFRYLKNREIDVCYWCPRGQCLTRLPAHQITQHTRSHSSSDRTAHQIAQHTRSHSTPDRTAHQIAQHTRSHSSSDRTAHQIAQHIRSHSTPDRTAHQITQLIRSKQTVRHNDGASSGRRHCPQCSNGMIMLQI